MRKIKWESVAKNSWATAKVGNCLLYCNVSTTRSGKARWSAEVGVGNRWKFGPLRHSLEKTKEDCIRLASELLIDCRESLREELKHFDLEME